MVANQKNVILYYFKNSSFYADWTLKLNFVFLLWCTFFLVFSIFYFVNWNGIIVLVFSHTHSFFLSFFLSSFLTFSLLFTLSPSLLAFWITDANSNERWASEGQSKKENYFKDKKIKQPTDKLCQNKDN